VFDRRARDWRNGAVVYQVLVDRFAPPEDLAAKAHLYPAPKVLRRWDEVPVTGHYLADERLWSHEIEFWGGDLTSLSRHLDHIENLGADVLYLSPIHLAYTNHGYDALDYAEVAPHLGTRQDVVALAASAHERGMRLVLDGVFNHMGRNSAAFRSAQDDPDSPFRAWFDFGEQYPGGVRSWWLAQNLPELVLEEPAVRQHIYAAPDSIVRGYLRDGVDGWRLDVAFEIGFRYLAELTEAAHAEKPGSLVVGEITSHPKEWFPSVDAVMNFPLREIILGAATREISGRHAQEMIARLIADADFEHLLKSWIFLENHDTPRLASIVTDPAARRMAQVLQFTLPGAPNLYYGGEVGMTGGGDPEMRAPMRWDLVTDTNPTLAWTRQLVDLHQSHRALRVGQFRPMTSERLIAFERYTDHVGDTVLVIANPSDEEVDEAVQLVNSKLMDPWPMLNLLGDAEVLVGRGLVRVTVPPGGVLVLAPEIHPAGGYSSYKRVQ
jgi:cyclomaltodextrinase